ncbi:MAG: serine hydrolase [Phycisphaerales bacterium]|nr:serine hydrolase [Planctomycetota bacterium]
MTSMLRLGVVLCAIGLFATFGAAARQPSAPGTATPTVAVPDTASGKQLRWVLDFLNGAAPLGEVHERFSEKFLAAVPPDKLTAVLDSLKSGPFKGGARLVKISEGSTDSSLVATVQGGDAPLEVSISTDGAGLMDGLLFRPSSPPKTALSSWADFDKAFEAFPGAKNFAAYALSSTPGSEPALRPVHTLAPDLCLATGSTFKLYILGTIAEQILAGKGSWEEKIAIREDLKSLPGGVMQNEPAGKEFPLSEFAAKMISISDNTATDHLLTRAGRGNVEKYMAGFNSCASRNLPFLGTMEMFRIKLAPDRTLAARFAAADEKTRRSMLESEVAKAAPDLAFAEKWTVPIEIERVEWFSSAADLCKAMVRLHEMEARPGMAELVRVLRINGGIPFDRKMWVSVAYKGGSEPGVMNLTWLLERNDGAVFVVSMGWNDTKAEVDQGRLVGLARGMADLLAKEKK